MADENTPAFYPRVGRNIAKNFRSAQPPAFIEDPRAMDLPQYGDVDLSVPSKENLELARRIAERDAQLRRQREADRSPLEKLAGGLQAGRFLGSAMTQGINSIPTRLVHGDEAAEKFMQDRIYKPEQPSAMEYAGDVGDFLEKLETEYKIPPVMPEAVALQYLTGPATSQATRAAGRGAEKAGMALERGMEPVVRGALERGGLPREMVMAMGANTQSNVVKPKGGNWLAGSVEKVLDPLIQKGIINNVSIPYGPEFDAAAMKRIAELKEAASQPDYTGGAGRVAEHLERDINNPRRAGEAAMNKWIQSNLTNYVKKDMGTPEDPVRRLAEEGVSHLPTDSPLPLNMGAVKETRKEAGFPEPYGQSWQGLLYESKADKPIGFGTAGEMINRGKGEPWMEKVDPFTKVYGMSPMDSVNFTQDIGFNHIIDVLREDIAAGRIRPEQLNKVSMEQAVRRTAEYDQEMAKKMAQAQAKITEGMPVVKEYPEGYKWIELAKPTPADVLPEGWSTPVAKGNTLQTVSPDGKIVLGDSIPEIVKNIYRRHPETPGNPEQMLEDALKYEGETMGHCVGGYCPDVLEGRSRIYSLRDAKGEPHVTVEVEPNQNPYPVSGEAFAMLPQATKAQYGQYVREWRQRNPNIENLTDEHTTQALKEAGVPPQPDRIVQIKGKGNAKPKDNYLPFVQDFVRSGEWSDVGDFRNTGLEWQASGPKGIFDPKEIKTLEQAGYKVPKFLTNAEKDDLVRNLYELDTGNSYDTGLPKQPPTGMKAGGKVSISNNPDTMMLEVNNKRMAGGGSEDDTDLTKPFFGGAGTKKYAAAKKRAEAVEPITERYPKTSAAVMGLMGTPPDEMGFSVLNPEYKDIMEVADPAFYAGTALGVAPLMKVFKAPAMALGRAGEKFAEKVVPQIMERGGVGADILGGLAQGTRSYAYLPHTEKSPNPLVGTRYKTQHVGNLAPKFDFDVQAEQGSSVMSNPWDLTSRGEKVLEVSDIPMSNQMITEGGHDFARDLANIKATIGGASGRQIAERMQDRVNDAHFANLFDKGTGRVFTMPSTMDVKGSHFSTMPTDLVMDIFQQAGLKPKDVERITDDLRTFMFETEKGKFRNAAPVGSPEFLLQLRQGGKGFSAGDLRKGLMDRMSKSEYQKMLGFNIEDVYGAIGDQSLKGLPKGFVGNTMIETSPFAGLKPATHQSYDTANMGKYAGSMPSMPLELMMPDLFRAIEINYLKDPRYRKLTPLQLRTMIVNTIEKRGNVISQPINQRVVDNVMRYKQGLAQGHFQPNDYEGIMKFMQSTGGYKDGGAVHKAEGGEVTGDDLILEERPL